MAQFPEKLMVTAQKLVNNCCAGTELQGLDDYYHPDCVSVEALDMQGNGRETAGLEGIKGKHQWWSNAIEEHSSSTEGPFLHGDNQFSVIFKADVTWKESGERMKMKEIGVYTVNDNGQITREKFFYSIDD